jgi:hypothetical protein
MALTMRGDWRVGMDGCITETFFSEGPGTYRPIERGQGARGIFLATFARE